eukprot:14325718-Alexandrium_andersonii.AAC.1
MYNSKCTIAQQAACSSFEQFPGGFEQFPARPLRGGATATPDPPEKRLRCPAPEALFGWVRGG